MAETAHGPLKPGRPITMEEKEHLEKRRQEAVMLRARAMSYGEIAAALGISTSSARLDIRTALRNAARAFSDLEKREEIAAMYLVDLRRLDRVLEGMMTQTETGVIVSQPVAFESMTKTRAGIVNHLARLYGFANGTAILIPGATMTPTNGIANGRTDWTHGIDPERVKAMRDKYLEFIDSARSAVPAQFQVEANAGEPENGGQGPGDELREHSEQGPENSREASDRDPPDSTEESEWKTENGHGGNGESSSSPSME